MHKMNVLHTCLVFHGICEIKFNMQLCEIVYYIWLILPILSYLSVRW